MKGFEKFLLIVFSLIIIVLAVCVLFVSTGVVDVTAGFVKIKGMLMDNRLIGAVIGAILAVLGLIGVFTPSDDSDDKKSGLAIKGEKGTIYITKDTFENIILGVTYKFVELKNVKVDVLMSEEGVLVSIYASILPDTIVPNLTSKLQENVKSSVLKQTTVEIKEVNIKIKGVYLDTSKK